MPRLRAAYSPANPPPMIVTRCGRRGWSWVAPLAGGRARGPRTPRRAVGLRHDRGAGRRGHRRSLPDPACGGRRRSRPRRTAGCGRASAPERPIRPATLAGSSPERSTETAVRLALPGARMDAGHRCGAGRIVGDGQPVMRPRPAPARTRSGSAVTDPAGHRPTNAPSGSVGRAPPDGARPQTPSACAAAAPKIAAARMRLSASSATRRRAARPRTSQRQQRSSAARCAVASPTPLPRGRGPSAAGAGRRSRYGYLSRSGPVSTAWAAASRATGTRNGEQDT